MHEKLSIATRDGSCPVHVFTAEGSPDGPAVICYSDAFGIRPALSDMCQRLADGGYVVLLPDLFYRLGSYQLPEPKATFASGNVGEIIGPLLASTSPTLAARDTEAFLDYLFGRPDVFGDRVGTTGYCMGGAISLTVAGTYPDVIAAAASFHGGYLATDSDTSPHLLAPKIKAYVYVAGAEDDESYPPEMAERLDRALSQAGVDHLCEIYAGARHGWTMSDLPVYNPTAAERHWDALFALLGSTLRNNEGS